jgi:hypothetical protein
MKEIPGFFHTKREYSLANPSEGAFIVRKVSGVFLLDVLLLKAAALNNF